MFKKYTAALYEGIREKYPAVISMYERYKLHNADFHRKNKYKSAIYLFKLVGAQRRGRSLYGVKLPKGASHRTFSLISPHIDNVPCRAIPDTSLIKRKSVIELAAELDEYEVVSFDVFDTLLFRPFADPRDMFYLLGARLGYFNFKEIRIAAERDARKKTAKPNFEVDIYDIYRELERRTGLSAEDAECEIALEEELCYPNPYMLELFRILLARNKKIVIVSDMYLPHSVIEGMLMRRGFYGYRRLYVSCEYGFGKTGGKLFSFVKRDFGTNIIHIGDSVEADINGAARAKISAYHYTQCNEFGNFRRPASLISPASSLYKGIVNNFIYNGYGNLSARESFGFMYASPIVIGFCEWLNRFCKYHETEKIFFLARDMYSFHKIYNRHFCEYDNEYVVTSRFALQELIVSDYPEEYFHHTIRARCDRGYTVGQALREINLEFLIAECDSYGLNERDIIVTDKLARIRNLFIDNKNRIAEHFESNERAAKMYFEEKLGGARRVCVADLGWRGSILAYLRFLLVKRWGICDEVLGVLVASTVNDSSVEFISDATVTSYAYSHIHNRDLLSAPNWESEYIRIMMLEAVFTSEERSLLEYRLTADGKYTMIYGAENRNGVIVREFVRGIERFADELESVRRENRDIYPISAVDAFVPMLDIAENHEYIARIIGDVVDTPYAIAGLGIKDVDYVPLGELMHDRKMIREWPIKEK